MPFFQLIAVVNVLKSSRVPVNTLNDLFYFYKTSRWVCVCVCKLVCVRVFCNTHVGQRCTADFWTLAPQSHPSGCHVSFRRGLCVLAQTYIDTFVVRQTFFTHLAFICLTYRLFYLPLIYSFPHSLLFFDFYYNALPPLSSISLPLWWLVWLVCNNSLALVAFSLFIRIYWLSLRVVLLLLLLSSFAMNFCKNFSWAKVGRLSYQTRYIAHIHT